MGKQYIFLHEKTRSRHAARTFDLVGCKGKFDLPGLKRNLRSHSLRQRVRLYPCVLLRMPSLSQSISLPLFRPPHARSLNTNAISVGICDGIAQTRARSVWIGRIGIRRYVIISTIKYQCVSLVVQIHIPQNVSLFKYI